MNSRNRPVSLNGKTTRCVVASSDSEGTQVHNIFITVNRGDDGKIFEVFASAGKSGEAQYANVEAMCRAASLWFRGGGDPMEIVTQWRGIRAGPDTFGGEGKRYSSIPDAIAQVLAEELKDGS